jgi:hypothetical protein
VTESQPENVDWGWVNAQLFGVNTGKYGMSCARSPLDDAGENGLGRRTGVAGPGDGPADYQM